MKTRTVHRINLLLTMTMLLTSLLAATPGRALAQEAFNPLEACREGAFSTEEDFVMQEGDQPDGDLYISDGDVLSVSGLVCMRNAELLSTFYRGEGPDLGLDALDILNIADRIVAFSPELDDPLGRFTAGDLLFTPGFVIPNAALLAAFDVHHDIGLDAVQLIGDPNRILEFVSVLAEFDRDHFIENPKLLIELLEKYDINIWFSVEGTQGPTDAPQILDGDLLSARTGSKVFSHDALLNPPIPAGIPSRGVDFGLDAAMTNYFFDVEKARSEIRFSTEILYRGTELPFTDGDVLKLGGAVVAVNADLIAKFAPAADFLGLDALDGAEPTGDPDRCDNHITDIGGMNVDVANINAGGKAEIGYPTDHPFGSHVPIWGTICDDALRFRVVFRKAADGPGPGAGIPVTPDKGWIVKDRHPITGKCTETVPWASDADGWYDAVRFHELLYCNPNLILTDWNSTTAPDPEDFYRIWLEFDRGAGVESEATTYPVQLDNTPVKFNDLNIPGGACTIYNKDDMPIMVQGDFSDEHFWSYRLSIAGAAYPDHYYPSVAYYDLGPAAANINQNGTTPAATLVDLHEIDVSDLVTAPDEPVACAYAARIWVRDRTIVGGFNAPFNITSGSFRSATSQAIFFNFAP